MKILYVLNSGTPGGMEQHVLYLVKGMIGLGHEVHVWCKPGEIYGWFEQAGAKMTEAEVKSDIDPTYISALGHYLEDNNIDVIHAHELKAVVNSLIAANKFRTKVKITHTHTPISEWPAGGMLTSIKRFIQFKLYSYYVNKYASVEIALTESRRKVKMREGITESKLRIIPNCFNSEAFTVADETRENFRREIRIKYGIPLDALVFVNVGRLSVEKNQEFLINAFSDLDIPKNSNVYLLFAGGGILENHLKDVVKSKKIKEKVIFTGIFSQENLPKFYYAGDVFVFPSKAEGFGLVLIEALAAAMPVLASDLPVLKEVGSDTVDYFSLHDKAYLTKMLQGYVKYFSENGVIPLNVKGQERVNMLYTEQAFVAAYENLYKELLG